LPEWGCGLNVGSIEAIIPGRRNIVSSHPSYKEISDFLNDSLRDGSIGLKLFGGHAPLTPKSTEMGIDIANDLKVIVAFHAGTTETQSDITGMREAVKLTKGKRLLLAHINAYCRGRTSHYMNELKEAFSLLQNNENIFSDSHLAVMNGTKGDCTNGIPNDHVTRVCLENYNLPVTKNGLEQAISTGLVRVIENQQNRNKLLAGDLALKHWKYMDTKVQISFPANIPTVGVACATEKNNNDFLIKLSSTDGGGIPRNNLIKRMMSLFHLGYLSLEDIVNKISLSPAKMFGLENKGHLSIGADADITVVDISKSESTMSFINGEMNMKKGMLYRKGGKILITEKAEKMSVEKELDYQVINLNNSLFYQ